PREGAHLLDMAAGTGDISLRYLKKSLEHHLDTRVTLCDYNRSMLDVAEKRLVEHGFLRQARIVNADAAQLPFEDNTFDSYVISYGLRNVTFIDQALSEAYRVLKPGGNFVCLEFSKVKNPLFSKIYHAYRFDFIPKLGQCLAKDEDSYTYLAESIEQFYSQETLKMMLEEAQFQHVSFEDILFGVSAIHQGIKV
ncbi:MAG: ubiquinone/menaquinone biosynthesis methyltransferase, partial [Alphaproteobacteria bacterium]|nr:ubiquinone/menaquinone biosynthesis methyltransferase [Alphaproteobacteria bacterium]